MIPTGFFIFLIVCCSIGLGLSVWGVIYYSRPIKVRLKITTITYLLNGKNTRNKCR